MGKIIAIAALRGGVGKTTMTLNLAQMLSEMGKKVLTVDFDSLASLTFRYKERNEAAFDLVPSSDYLAKSQDIWREKYDYIVFDTAPSVDESTAKALELADEVIIPVVSEFEDLMEIHELKQVIAKIKNVAEEDVCVMESTIPWVKDGVCDDRVAEGYRELTKKITE